MITLQMRIFTILIALTVLAQGKSDIWNIPRIGRPTLREGSQPLNLAVSALYPGISMLKQRDVARGLSEEVDSSGQPLFNVTLLTMGNILSNETETLHQLEMPFGKVQRFPEYHPIGILDKHRYFNKLVMSLFGEKRETLDQLKELNFDFAIMDGMPALAVLAQELGIPYMLQTQYMPDPFLSTLLNLPSQSSYAYQMLVPSPAYITVDDRIQPRSSFGSHISILVRHFVPQRIEKLLHETEQIDPALLDQCDLSFAYGFGADGLIDRIQQADNTAFFYPLTRRNSKFSKQDSAALMAPELSQFVQKYESVVLVAFGSATPPPPTELINLVKQFKFSKQSIGFIIALQERHPAYNKIEELSFANVLLQSELSPTQDLFQRLDLWISHCGPGPSTEALYHGVPILGLPMSPEQIGSCARYIDLGVAQIVDWEQLQGLPQIVDAMTSKDSRQRQNAQLLMQRLEFQETRGDKDMLYWIQYNRRFGSQHLINPHHRRSYREVYDIDIIALILCCIALALWLVYQTTIRLCGCKFKSKYDREQLTQVESQFLNM